jgi:hypothetical protein
MKKEDEGEKITLGCRAGLFLAFFFIDPDLVLKNTSQKTSELLAKCFMNKLYFCHGPRDERANRAALKPPP